MKQQMKHTFCITPLIVVAMLCGLCMPAQAQVTLDFDAYDMGGATYKAISTVTPWSENGYTLDLVSGTGGFLDKSYNGSVSNFTINVVGGFGSAIIEFNSDNNYTPHVKRLGIPDEIIEHGTQEQLQNQ